MKLNLETPSPENHADVAHGATSGLVIGGGADTIALLVVGTTTLVGCAGGVTVTDDDASVIVTDAGFLTGDEASIQGTISITAAGCVGITDTQGDTYPTVWPRGTSLVDDSEIAINISDVGIKQLGDEVNGAGGYYEIGTRPHLDQPPRVQRSRRWAPVA